MDAKVYLKSFGWTEGEPLKKGGLKKPILVKHKKDTKGLGHDSNNADMWWEKLFDGQLKNLEVNSGNSTDGVSFKHNNETVLKTLNRNMSPLYRMFVKGEGLEGTVGKIDHTRLANITDLATKAAEQMEKLTSTSLKKSKKKLKDKSNTKVDIKGEKIKKSKKDLKDKLKKRKEKKELVEKELDTALTSKKEKAKIKKRRERERESIDDAYSSKDKKRRRKDGKEKELKQ